MWRATRRDFLRTGAAAAAVGWGWKETPSLAQAPPGERPPQDKGVEVLNPQARVPLSFFIDDSTCLVNMGHFCMPQLAEAWPGCDSYRKPWKTWPREIPDAFVREFGEWCAEPKLEHVRGRDGDDPQATVSLPAGTGDWFGQWHGDGPCEGHRYANRDATDGRLVELIERGEPAVMFCHWPGLYTHGTKQGFQEFQQVILALEGRYHDQTIWMKASEMARYWAAKELTRYERTGNRLRLSAPLASPRFTLRVATSNPAPPRLDYDGKPIPVREVSELHDLGPGTWLRQRASVIICFDLPKGRVVLSV